LWIDTMKLQFYHLKQKKKKKKAYVPRATWSFSIVHWLLKSY
jgi:hypothetical protein